MRFRSALVPTLALAGLLQASPVAFAAEEAETVLTEPDREAYARTTIISFSELQVEGELARPDGSYVNTRRNTRFRSLIRIRGDFRPELLSSIDAL